ncbi:MAG TPA: dihydrolipoamide acetyltransferase family protein [Paludibacter sp.]|nr:dihydrolipoamide acetyltransferase family protein [Paludibacter sp.]
MRYFFNFPDIGEGLEEGTILEWYVKVGQTIKAGQALVNMETDKIVTDIPSPKAGTIVAVFGSVGETVHVGSPLVEIETEGTALEEKKVAPVAEPIKTEVIEEGAAVVGTMELAGNSAALPASNEGSLPAESDIGMTRKALATPLARAMARELKIDINTISGTGPSGRVTKEDIQNFNPTSRLVDIAAERTESMTQPASADLTTYEPLSQIRKAIAKNMLNSKQKTAHMTLFEEVEISELMRIREKFKQEFSDKNIKLTYLPFIVKATVQALKKYRTLNSQLDLEHDQMIYINRYNIAIAVDTPEGLVVPVIKDADKLSIWQIAQKITELSDKAHNRKLTLDDMREGTFTLTNYGSIGGIFATPVINYPQAGILGIGRIVKKPVVKGDQIIIGYVLPLSLSVDHRIVDGGDASRFMNRIVEYLNDPVILMME